MEDRVVVRAAVASMDRTVRKVISVQKAMRAPWGVPERSPWSRFQTRCSIYWGSIRMRNGAKAFGIVMVMWLLPTVGICQQLSNSQSTSAYLQSKAVRRLALVISNQFYDYADEVKSADVDTKEIIALLQDTGFTMIRSIPGASTKGEILSWAQDLANAAGSSNDPVIFF